MGSIGGNGNAQLSSFDRDGPDARMDGARQRSDVRRRANDGRNGERLWRRKQWHVRHDAAGCACCRNMAMMQGGMGGMMGGGAQRPATPSAPQPMPGMPGMQDTPQTPRP